MCCGYLGLSVVVLLISMKMFGYFVYDDVIYVYVFIVWFVNFGEVLVDLVVGSWWYWYVVVKWLVVCMYEVVVIVV